MVRACRSMPQEHWCGVVSQRLRSPPLEAVYVVYPTPAVPRWSAEEGASIRVRHEARGCNEGHLYCLYRQAMSRWAVASTGCNVEVKELALKGTREARCRLLRCGAWLRGHMVSSSEADFNRREKAPLPRTLLHRLV